MLLVVTGTPKLMYPGLETHTLGWGTLAKPVYVLPLLTKDGRARSFGANPSKSSTKVVFVKASKALTSVKNIVLA